MGQTHAPGRGQSSSGSLLPEDVWPGCQKTEHRLDSQVIEPTNQHRHGHGSHVQIASSFETSSLCLTVSPAQGVSATRRPADVEDVRRPAHLSETRWA